MKNDTPPPGRAAAAAPSRRVARGATGGSYRKNRPSQGVRLSQNTKCIADSTARHKVSHGTIITQLLSHDRWLTHADASFFSSA